MLTQIFGGSLACLVALRQVFHELHAVINITNDQLPTIFVEENVRGLMRSALVAVYKRMIAGDTFGIAGGKLKNIILTIRMQVARPGKGGFQ